MNLSSCLENQECAIVVGPDANDRDHFYSGLCPNTHPCLTLVSHRSRRPLDFLSKALTPTCS